MLELTIVIVYFIAMVLIGITTRRDATDTRNFFILGQKGSTLYITGSLFATIVGASATLGMAGLGYSRGLTGGWWVFSGCIGLVILGFFFARKVREYGLFTLPELAGKQYNEWVRLAVSVLIPVAWLGVIGGQIIAAGKIMSVLGMGTPEMWMVISTAVFVLYCLLGGQWAAVKTDLYQGIIISVGLIGGLIAIFAKTGGIGQFWAKLPQGFTSFPVSDKFSTYDLVKTLLLVGLTYVVGPDMYSRVFSAKDGATARRSVFWTAGLLVPLTLAVVLTGMVAAVLFPGIASEQAFPTVIKSAMTPAVAGLVLAALLCAVMSSANTCLLSASTIMTRDIIQKLRPGLTDGQVLFISRTGIVVLGALSLCIALYLKGIISSLMFAYTIYTAGVIPLVIAGFWRERLKVTPLAALAALVGGGGTALASQIMKIKYLDLGALGVSVVLLFLVSAIENWAHANAGQTAERTK